VPRRRRRRNNIKRKPTDGKAKIHTPKGIPKTNYN